MSRTAYTFTPAGVTFYRITGDELEPWFQEDPQYTKDSVLGGSSAYYDLGAYVTPPLSFRASCASAADRLSLIAALWQEGTLSNTRGHSDTALLVKARPINSNPYDLWQCEVSFERVGS
jgi:hypothetical protein